MYDMSQAWMRGELDILQDWCHEAVRTLFTLIIGVVI